MITTLLLNLNSCFLTDENISYDDTEIETEDILTDSSFMKMISLPVIYDSTDYLIFPLTYNDNSYENRSSGYFDYERSASGGSYDYSSSGGYLSDYYYYGKFYNLIFQNINTGKINYLTNDRILGQNFRYLRKIYKQTGKQYILLNIKDKDTNKDGKLDHDDVATLYICHISGQNLKKLSPENEYVVNSTIVEKTNELYFQTKKDINKDGFFDRKDSTLLYKVDFKNNLKVSKINFNLNPNIKK